MNLDAAARVAAASSHRDVDAGPRGCTQAPVGGGASMTEHRLGSAGKDRGRHLSFSGHHSVADREHAAVHGSQSAGCEAMLDRPGPEAKRHQLPTRHHSVLRRGETGKLPIGGGTFLTPSGVANSTHVRRVTP
jgi:hypothetical protein